MPTITETKESVELEEKLSQPFVLWLHNDDYNSFDHVIECMIKICGHDANQASQIAHLVHYTGKCDVKRGDREKITKMYNLLKAANLTVTMEEV